MEPARSDSKSSQNDPASKVPEHGQSKGRGGWRAVKYIIGNESFEKLASMSLVSNLTMYLRTQYNLNGLFLTNVVQIWSGSCNVASIAGAVVSDAYLGRYLTLLCGTVFSLVGLASITLTAGVHELRPPACHELLNCIQPHPWQLAILFVALVFMGLGAGGIRPCSIAFGADQFDTTTEKGRSQLECFFDWWYFSFTIVLIIALTGVVYVQTNISWAIGYAIPTFCFVMSLTVFIMGRHTYIYKTPQGSVFVDLAKVVVAATKKRKVNLSATRKCSFYDPEATDIEGNQCETPKFQKIDRFKCLDKAAAIVDPSELDSRGKPINGWRLCSVQQVHNLKCLLGVIPVWVSGITCFMVLDQTSTYGILQAIQTDRRIGTHFTIPPGWMGITSMVALSIWIVIYEQIYIPVMRRIITRDPRLTMKEKISIGILMSIFSMVVSGIVEIRRKSLALKAGSFQSSLHVTMLLPQFVLSGLTEAFAAVSIMEFFTLRLPETMRSVAGALFFLSLSMGSYMSNLIVNIIHSATGGHGKIPWLGDGDLNKSKLENYYFIIASLATVNFIYFNLYAHKYVPSKTDIAGGGGEVQLQKQNSTADHPAS